MLFYIDLTDRVSWFFIYRSSRSSFQYNRVLIPDLRFNRSWLIFTKFRRASFRRFHIWLQNLMASISLIAWANVDSSLEKFCKLLAIPVNSYLLMAFFHHGYLNRSPVRARWASSPLLYDFLRSAMTMAWVWTYPSNCVASLRQLLDTQITLSHFCCRFFSANVSLLNRWNLLLYDRTASCIGKAYAL